jgi:predicted RecB family nuclease
MRQSQRQKLRAEGITTIEELAIPRESLYRLGSPALEGVKRQSTLQETQR